MNRQQLAEEIIHAGRFLYGRGWSPATSSNYSARLSADEALLTVATTFTFANTWLAWRLGSFQVEHPDLAVRLATSNKLVDLKAGEADVAIRASARRAPSRIRW